MQYEVIEGFRLSPQQRYLWTLQKNSECYCAQAAFLLDGDLRAGALKEAVRDVVKRHEILRTTFYRTPGTKAPIQVIADNVLLRWQAIELFGNDPDNLLADVDGLLEKERSRLFDPQQGPSMCTTLVTLSDSRHLLLTSLPSLCADAWTLKNLLHEISRSYAAAIEGEEIFEEVVQYAEFSEWQNDLLEGEEADVGRDYWRKQGGLESDHLLLPFESKPGRTTTFEPGCITAVVPLQTVAEIERIAGLSGTSVAAVLMTCWQALLWRLTGEPDAVVVANVTAGRRYEELYAAMGLFSKPVPVPYHFEGDTRFEDVLNDVHRATMDAEAYQEYFICEQGEGTTSGESSSLIGFEFQEVPKRTAAGVSFCLYKQYLIAERFKVKLSCLLTNGTLLADLYYDSDILSADAISRLAGQFEVLLRSVTSNPEARVGDLEIVNDAERQQLLVEFNATKAGYPRNLCTHHLFEQQAERNGREVALVCESLSLSYAELNRRADRLASLLRSRGARPDLVVGLCLERGFDLVTALLAILKSGAAYLPIDSSLPPHRIKFMLDDSHASLVVSRQCFADLFADTSANLVDLDSLSLDASTPPEPVTQTSRLAVCHPQNLAYVIYTSGSTGKPKGVMIPHSGLVNYLTWAAKAYHLEDGTGAPVHSPVAFDLTVTSLLTPLISGRAVYLSSDLSGIEPLSHLLSRRKNMSLIKLTPAHLQALSMVTDWEVVKGCTRRLVIGGEALMGEALSAWAEHDPSVKVVNEYGPTETVVGCCVYEQEAGLVKPGPVPIGRPIANTQLYILDEQLRPVAKGVGGEIHVAGEGVGRGYLDRPDQTAERFIPNPFSQRGGERMYKTGDVACYSAGGDIYYIGRADRQVKLRGYRVELGEVEEVLKEVEGVADAAVEVIERGGGESRLVGYVVADRGKQLDIDSLRDEVRRKVPDYMVAADYIQLEQMPLTSNGKLDRKALRKMELEPLKPREPRISPQNELERIIASIWQEVLHIEEISVNDNFFDIGGHSLFMLQVQTKLRHASNLDVVMTDLFKYPTIKSLSKFLSQGERNDVSTRLARIQVEKLEEGRDRLRQRFRLSQLKEQPSEILE